MKTLIFTISTLAIIIGTKVDNSLNSVINNYFTYSLMETSTMHEEVSQRGEVNPFIDFLALDAFEVVDKGEKVETIIVDGERIPVVTLPELNIVASK